MYPGLPAEQQLDEDEPYAEVHRVGRWTYAVSVCHGISRWGPGGGSWHVLGRGRAERKARRVLAQYRRQEQRETERYIVGS